MIDVALWVGLFILSCCLVDALLPERAVEWLFGPDDEEEA